MTRRMVVDSLLLLIVPLGLAVATAIGGPMPVGSLVGSRNATLDGHVPLPHTTMLSGDSLQVDDGLAVVSLNRGNRMILGHGTRASFLRETGVVTVSMTQGNVSLYHSGRGGVIQVRVGNVTIVPAKAYRTLGEVAMADGRVLVTAKDGVLRVEKAGTAREVGGGKTITISTTVARAPTPVPPGKEHLKHILSIGPADLLYVGLAGEVGGTVWAITSLTSSGPAVSPVTPTH